MSSLSRLSVLFLLCLLSSRDALPAADLKEPYKVRVVVHVENHRLLTRVFSDQMRRELRDGLQAALGALAQVEETTTHPLLDDVHKFGLGKALDGYRERSAYHTHFVLIDFSGTYYQIQTRMHDGLTGLSSPVVRKGRTRDRAYVSRMALFLMERDLGLTGTVQDEPNSDGLVKVELRGGGLGVDLGKWVKKDEVFSLVSVQGTSPGRKMPYAVLQVVEPPRDGVCTCKFYSRFRGSQVTGLRCVLLGTRTGPLRLRLVQEKPGGGTGPLEGAVALQLRHRNFDGNESGMLHVTPPPGKDIDTSTRGEKGQFSRLAFVSVLSGDTVRARIPVPILDDGLVVLAVPATNEANDLLLFRYRSLHRNVQDALAVQTQLFKEINELTAKPEERAKALAKVRRTLERTQQDHKKFRAELEEVHLEIKKADLKSPPSTAPIKQRLELIKGGEADLLKHVALLEKIDKEENDPKRKEWLVQQEGAKLLEKEGELGKAIAIYEKAAPEFQTAALKKHVEDLKKLWEPKNDKHKEARRFIYETFPKLDTVGLESRIKDAQDALAVCKAEGDALGAAKMHKGLESHADRIEKEFNELKPDANLEDEKPAKRIKELLPSLQKLNTDVQEFLAKHKSG